MLVWKRIGDENEHVTAVCLVTFVYVTAHKPQTLNPVPECTRHSRSQNGVHCVSEPAVAVPCHIHVTAHKCTISRTP